MKKLLIALVLFGGFTVWAQAPIAQANSVQNHEVKTKSNNPLVQKLGIDTATASKIKSLSEKYRPQLQAKHLDNQEKEIELKRLLLSDTPDQSKVEANIHARAEIWAQIQILKVHLDGEIRQLLTKDQWERYLQFRIAEHRRNESHRSHPNN